MSELYELVATSVTSALAIELGKIFPTITRYREVIPAQLLAYPHFFINQLTISTQAERRNHWHVDYLATIRYRAAADPATIVGTLQQQLDDIGIRMLSELEYIHWNDVPVQLKNPRIEKVDDVLHFFCNISVMATKPVEPGPLQESLDVNISII